MKRKKGHEMLVLAPVDSPAKNGVTSVAKTFRHFQASFRMERGETKLHKNFTTVSIPCAIPAQRYIAAILPPLHNRRSLKGRPLLRQRRAKHTRKCHTHTIESEDNLLWSSKMITY